MMVEIISVFWISPGGQVHEGLTHVGIVERLIREGVIDTSDMFQLDLSPEEGEEFLGQLEFDQQQLEEISLELMVFDGWIRGLVGRRDELGFQGTLRAMKRQEAEIERIVRERGVKNVYVDIETQSGDKPTESILVTSDDMAEGFIKAVELERRMTRMTARRRPSFLQPVRVRAHRRRR